MIVQVLEQDPRPAYLADDPRPRSFGMHLCEVNVRWIQDGHDSLVTSIGPVDS